MLKQLQQDTNCFIYYNRYFTSLQFFVTICQSCCSPYLKLYNNATILSPGLAIRLSYWLNRVLVHVSIFLSYSDSYAFNIYDKRLVKLDNMVDNVTLLPESGYNSVAILCYSNIIVNNMINILWLKREGWWCISWQNV